MGLPTRVELERANNANSARFVWPVTPNIRGDLKLVVNFLNREPTLDRLHYAMSNFLAPTVDVPRTLKPAARKKDADFMDYYAPSLGLMVVLHELNHRVEKPQWEMVPDSKIAKFKPVLVRREFHDPLWSALARLLETGNVYWIGRCLVCKKFFVKNRYWQKVCPKACRKTYENRAAADRQAKARRERKRAATKRGSGLDFGPFHGR